MIGCILLWKIQKGDRLNNNWCKTDDNKIIHNLDSYNQLNPFPEQ